MPQNIMSDATGDPGSWATSASRGGIKETAHHFAGGCSDGKQWPEQSASKRSNKGGERQPLPPIIIHQ